MTLTESALNEFVRDKIAKWIWHDTEDHGVRGKWLGGFTDAKGRYRGTEQPQFATDAHLCLELLDEFPHWEIESFEGSGERYFVRIYPKKDPTTEVGPAIATYSSVTPCIACLGALIQAHGLELP